MVETIFHLSRGAKRLFISVFAAANTEITYSYSPISSRTYFTGGLP
jgi:hypothetical protein